MLSRSFLTVILFITVIAKVVAQDVVLSLANEYYLAGDYEKAIEEYDKLARKDEYVPLIYNNYVKALVAVQKSEEAQKFIKRAIKVVPEHLTYEIDHFLISVALLGQEKSEKEFLTIVNEVKKDPAKVEKAARYFLKNSRPAYAGRIYEAGRRESGEKYAYAQGLATVYGQQGEKQKMIVELLNWLEVSPESLSVIKNTLQDNLMAEGDFELLENSVYEKIEKNPNDAQYNELLLWLYVQRKDFSKAFVQAKALDRRQKSQGQVLLETGQIALENEDYANAARYFESIVLDYRTGPYYFAARRLLIKTREEEVKHIYPVNVAHVQELVTQYKSYIKEAGWNNPAAGEAARSMATLYAFYLNKIDSAQIILQQIIQQAGVDPRLQNRAKMDLADVLLLKGEPWESTLLYSQVEKAMKEDPLGHQAKFSNAKLAYYRGDFVLAKQHLDILKLATTREISNDAIDLSLFIQVNIDVDSNYTPLRKYAAAELLIFQHQYEGALKELDQILDSFPGHPLTDDIWFKEAQLYRMTARPEQAIVCLGKLLQRYDTDILGDDALYLLATIWDQDMKDQNKAMEYYQQCMLKYPSSIYVTEARRRYRQLRGDKL